MHRRKQLFEATFCQPLFEFLHLCRLFRQSPLQQAEEAAGSLFTQGAALLMQTRSTTVFIWDAAVKVTFQKFNISDLNFKWTAAPAFCGTRGDEDVTAMEQPQNSTGQVLLKSVHQPSVNASLHSPALRFVEPILSQ